MTPSGDCIVIGGARLYPAGSAGPTGVKHSVRVGPLDRKRSRPRGWWMLDVQTGERFGLIEGRLGESISADDMELEQLVERTLEAI